jgi:hypothetical protein
MPIVTVQLGPICAGGGHVEIREVIDGVVVSTRAVAIDTLVARPARAQVADKSLAVERILAETEAQNFAAFKLLAEAKSVSVPAAVAVAPVGVEPLGGEALKAGKI